MNATIIENKLSDGSSVYAVNIRANDGNVWIDCTNLESAEKLQKMLNDDSIVINVEVFA